MAHNHQKHASWGSVVQVMNAAFNPSPHCMHLTKDRYGVIIGHNRSVGIFAKQTGICALIDGHQDIGSNSGAVITIASSFEFLILEYARMLSEVHSG